MTIANGNGSGQSASADQSKASWSDSSDHVATVRTKGLGLDALSALRQAISDRGWDNVSLASAMKKDESFVRRVLSGEKPMPAGFFDDLPHDAVGLFHARQAEAHGRIVVDPVDQDSAFRHLAIGLLSIAARGVASVLPTKARSMASMKADTGNGQGRKAG
jgi:hypothetical protein